MAFLRHVYIPGITLAAALIAAGCGPFGDPEVSDDNVCVVGGQVVDQEDWDVAMTNALGQDEVRFGAEPEEDSGPWKATRAQVTSELVRDAAYRQLAEDRGLTLEDGAVDDAWDEAIEQGAAGDAERFDRQIELEGRTETGFRAALERSLVQEMVLEDEVGELEPTESDLEEFLAADPAAWGGTPASRMVSQVIIVPGGPKSGTADDAAAEQLAQEIADSTAEQGRDALEDAARKLSDDPTYGPEGGQLNYEAGSFSREISEAVMEAEPGDVVGPLRSPVGWHVLMPIDDVVAGETPEVDPVRTAATAAWKTDRQSSAAEELQSELAPLIDDADCRAGYLDAGEADVDSAEQPTDAPVTTSDGEPAAADDAAEPTDTPPKEPAKEPAKQPAKQSKAAANKQQQ